MYINGRGIRIGGFWIWCSSCENYFHGSMKAPSWYENCIDVPQNKLTAEPGILETMKNKIDEQVNMISRKRAVEG
jgi:hypothetical protein